MVSCKNLLVALILCSITMSYSAASSCSPTPTVLGSWLYVVGSGNQFNGPLPSNWSTKHVAKGQYIFALSNCPVLLFLLSLVLCLSFVIMKKKNGNNTMFLKLMMQSSIYTRTS